MKKLLLSFMIVATALTATPKKANAAIIFAVANPFSGAIFVGSLSAIALGAGTFSTMGPYGQSPAIPVVMGLLTIAGTNSNDSELAKQYKTVPAYIFEEIVDLAKAKEDQAVMITKDLQEVVLTQSEVDELYSSLDERVDQKELKSLRKLLTTPSKI